MRVEPPWSRCLALALALWAALGSGCQREPEIRLVPIFPVDEPTLLTTADVARLYVTAEPVGATADEVDTPIQTSAERGESFALALPEGHWKVKMRGVDAADSELVYGETRPFTVRPGRSETVRFFLGRTMAFNLIELQPTEAADALADLGDHTATAFVDDDGRPFVLVAGGRRLAQEGGAPLAQALLIDAASHTVERLPALSCARAGHTAFTVQTEVGVRVVLAGGDTDDECSSTLDVYDPYARSFTKLGACGLGTTRGATPELANVGAQAEQSGRVIVAGNPRCAVDVVTGAGEAGQVLEGDAPAGAVAAGLNPLLGQQLVVTPDRLFVDRALAGAICSTSGGWDADAVWSFGELRVGGRLFGVNPQNAGGFLFVGGRLPNGNPPTYGWSYVVVNECQLSRVIEGAPELSDEAVLPTAGFALVDLELATGEDINLLLTGGYDELGEPLRSVALFHKPANSNIPTWHELSLDSRQHPLELRQPRAGHAAALLPDGSHWIIGGGSALAEIFIKGAGGLEADIQTLDRRSPPAASMAVIDTAEPPAVDGGVPDASLGADFALAYPDAIYNQAPPLTALVFLASSADRAVTDGLLDVELADSQGCNDPPGTIEGVVSGNVSGGGFDEDIFEVHPNSGTGGADSANTAAESRARTILTGIAASENGCAWRQLVRVGLGGLASAAEDAAEAEGLDLRLGINVVALVTADDDCSQQLYEDLADQVLPSADTLADHHCTTTATGAVDEFDDYFGLPPVDDWAPLFEQLLDGLVWNKSDLIVLVVGNTDADNAEQCTDGAYGGLRRPRRLLETLDAIAAAGARTVLVDVCEAADATTLSAGLDELEAAVADRNPWQACVPGDVAGIDPPYDDALQHYVPVDPDADQAALVADAVRERCRLVFREEDGSDHKHYVAFTVGDAEWRIGTNYDGRAEGCLGDVDEHLGWVLEVGQLTLDGADEVDMDKVELICVP